MKDISLVALPMLLLHELLITMTNQGYTPRTPIYDPVERVSSEAVEGGGGVPTLCVEFDYLIIRMTLSVIEAM